MDELEKCNKIVGNIETRLSELNKNFNKSKSMVQGAKTRAYFPFKLGHPFAATLRVGVDGIQMTVDGKHVTSFAYREVISLTLVLIVFTLISELNLMLFWLATYSDFGAMASQ